MSYHIISHMISTWQAEDHGVLATIKSKLIVQSVIKNINDNCEFTFDYLCLGKHTHTHTHSLSLSLSLFLSLSHTYTQSSWRV